MNAVKMVLLLGSGFFLVFGALGGILNITQLLSINLSPLLLIIIALVLALIYLGLINARLRWQLSRKRGMQSRIDKLASFRQIAITTLYATTPSPEEFPIWVERYQKWEA